MGDCEHEFMSGPRQWPRICKHCARLQSDIEWAEKVVALEAQVAELLGACKAVQFVLEKYDTGDEWEAGQTVATAIANVKGE